MKYCINCQRNVVPRRVFSFLWFFLLVGFFYLLYYPFKRKQCPSCGGKNFVAAKPLGTVGG